MRIKNITFVILLLVLAAGTVFLGLKYYESRQALENANRQLEAARINDRVLDFTKLFITSVLQADHEVDFETRLQLENLVRSIGDQEILTAWNRFINSQTEQEAQEAVKDLLEILV